LPSRFPFFASAFLAIAFAGHAAAAADKVTLGLVGNTSDAGFLIAEGKGYFKAGDIEIVPTTFDSAAKMMAPMGTGEIDVGSGATSAGLFNAAARGVGIRIVADRARMAPGYRYMTLMLKRELVESGKYKGLQDLKGLKIALASPGIAPSSLLNEAAKKGGLTFADIDKIYMGYPQQVPALTNGAIDGSLMIEPFTTTLLKNNTGVVVATTEDFYPSAQIAMVYFGEAFVKNRSETGRRFMVAYVKALRDFNDVIQDGKIGSGAKADEIAAIMAKGLGTTVENIRGNYVHAVDPDGRLNLDSVRKDLTFFKANGDVADKSIEVEKLLDTSFVDAAVKELGPYKR
jgi:NitT/TauT family transport system substrate-binding protein